MCVGCRSLEFSPSRNQSDLHLICLPSVHCQANLFLREAPKREVLAVIEYLDQGTDIPAGEGHSES